MPESINTGQPPTAERVERRGFPRRRMRGTASIVPADKPMSPGVRITLVDISQSGIGFLIAKELTLGQTIQIQLETSSVPGRPKGALQAEVRWTLPVAGSNQFRVGCAWSARLSYADLLNFS